MGLTRQGQGEEPMVLGAEGRQQPGPRALLYPPGTFKNLGLALE